MKKADSRFLQRSRRSQPKSRPNIAEQHVGPLDLVEGSFKSAGDSFLDQTLFEPDAQVSADDLHDVFRFERRGWFQELAETSGLWGWSSGAGDLEKRLLHFGKRDTGLHFRP